MADNYDDLTRAVAHIMDALCEAAFELTDANDAELIELFEHLRAMEIDERLIALIRDQVTAQREVNDYFDKEADSGETED